MAADSRLEQVRSNISAAATLAADGTSLRCVAPATLRPGLATVANNTLNAQPNPIPKADPTADPNTNPNPNPNPDTNPNPNPNPSPHPNQAVQGSTYIRNTDGCTPSAWLARHLDAEP